MFKNNTHRTQSTTQHLRAGFIFLAIALVLGSTGQATPAAAAPQDQVVEGERVGIRMGLLPPRSPLCVGRRYEAAAVVTRFVRTAESGQGFAGIEQTIGRLSYVMVEATVENESIGTISPERIQTGWDPDQINPQADFTFEAKKVGTTNLIFEALVPQRITGSRDAYVSRVHPIKVVNCKYKVQNYFSMYGIFGAASGVAMGYMETALTPTGEDISAQGDVIDVYTGEGILDVLESRTVLPCILSHGGFKSPTKITGRMTADPIFPLKLDIRYEPGQYYYSAACPYVSAEGSSSEDPTGFLMSSAYFPANGGTASKRLNFVGWLGTHTIVVTPLDNSQ